MDSRVPSGPVNAVDPEVGSEPSALACLVRVARQHGMHLSVSQLMHDNVLASREVTTTDLLKCAQSAGLKAKALKLNWNGLADLGKALPAIVRLKHGPSMVLQRVDAAADVPRVVLFDPLADDDTELVIDRVRFEDVWSGEVVLVKRNYDLADESQPFSLGLIVALIFRERRIVRDVAICAMVLGILGLTPIMFWRLMSDKVIYYKAFNTFYVLCLGYLRVACVRSGICLVAPHCSCSTSRRGSMSSFRPTCLISSSICRSISSSGRRSARSCTTCNRCLRSALF